MYVPNPNFLVDNPTVDEDTEDIATYLKNQINSTFYTALNYDVVKTHRSYYDIAIPIIDFSCLRVYKTADTAYADYSVSNISQYTINYIIAFTTKQVVADISAFIGRDILRLLVNSSLESNSIFQLDTSSLPTLEYDTFIAPNNTIYKYTNVSFSAYTALTNQL